MVKLVFSVLALALALLRLCRTVLSFEFTLSAAQQCRSLELSWTGSPTVQFEFPLLVRILPFSSFPITFPIAKHIWNESTTSGSLSLPITLCGGTQFLLAVTDCSGEGVVPVSDIMTVLGSHETSCLCTETSSSPHFTVQTSPDPSLCPLLRVSWDATVKGEHPTIIAFSPGVLPVHLDASEAAASMNNVVTSTGKFTSASQVVVLFDEKSSLAQTSPLVSIGGTDGAECFPSNSSATAEASSTSSSITTETRSDSQPARVTNKAGVIVGVVIAAVITVAAIIFAVLVYRQRRSRYENGLIPHTRFAASDMSINLRSLSSLSMLPPPVPPKSPWALARNAGVPSPPHPPLRPPTPPPKSPNVESSRRRSYTIRSPPDTSGIPVNANDAGSLSYEPRPDSPTLPDQIFLKEPTTPRSVGLTRCKMT